MFGTLSICVLFVAVIVLAVYCRYLQSELILVSRKASEANQNAKSARAIADESRAKSVAIGASVNNLTTAVDLNTRGVSQLKTWAGKLTDYLRNAMPAKMKACPYCDDQCEGHDDA